MISTYNKRFFILDLNRLLFYYLPERDSVLSNSTEIPLDSITRIYVEHQAHIGMTEQNTRHGFVVLTKKKAFKLVCDSQLIMEQLLFAFSNLVGAQSQKPLYDWNSYYTQDSQSNDSPSPSNQMNHQQPMMMPQQKMSQPVRVIYNTEQQQQQQQEGPLSPSERQMNKVEEVQNLQKMSESRQSSQSTQKSESECEQAVQSQNSIKAEETESTKVQIQEKPNPEMKRSPSPGSPGQRRSASKENRGRSMMSQGLSLNQVQNSDHMVEVQSLDVPSNQTNAEENKSIPALSTRQLQSFRRASASRQKVPINGGGITLSKIENVNAVPVKLAPELTPNKVIKVTSQFEATVNSRPSRVERIDRREDNYRSNVDTVPSRQPRSGAETYGFSQKDEPRVEESFNRDMPLSYLDIMKQKKREKQTMQSAPQEEPSAKYEAPRQLETEDDWDKDLFGDGQLSPARTTKKPDNSLSNYNSQYISQPNQSSAQISKLTGVNERKVVASIKEKTESFAPRGYVHNDWDDDL